MERTSLYRHYDAAGVLLYVGISTAHIRRLKDHRFGSCWYWDIARIEVEHFASRPEALAAEAAAIRRERPRYNTLSPWTDYRDDEDVDGWMDLASALRDCAEIPERMVPPARKPIGYASACRSRINREIRRLRRSGVADQHMFIDVADMEQGRFQPNFVRAVKAATYRGSRIICNWPEEFLVFPNLLRQHKIRVFKYDD